MTLSVDSMACNPEPGSEHLFKNEPPTEQNLRKLRIIQTLTHY